MGCDGGTIPRRDELVKTKKKPETKDKDLELAFKWRHCALTHEVLQNPVVMCGLGKFYNKIALIEALINKEVFPDGLSHVKSLREIKDLNLTPNPAFNDGEQKQSEGGIDMSTSPYICPISGLEMSGKFRFVALWSCGCTFAERALKEIKVQNCPQCQKPFTNNDIVVLNASGDDLNIMQERMELRQKNNKKKTKKIKKEFDEVKIENEAAETITKTKETKIKKDEMVAIQNSNKQKREGSKVANGEAKKAKSDYSVAKDPKVSDVYKSLFTSHKSEQEQGRAHWITYNPFYN